MVSRRKLFGIASSSGDLQQAEVLSAVSDPSDLCRTYPHTDAYACSYCRANARTDACSDACAVTDAGADPDCTSRGAVRASSRRSAGNGHLHARRKKR